MRQKKVFSTWLDAEIVNAIDAHCADKGITKANYLRGLVAADLGMKSEIQPCIRHEIPLKNRPAPKKDSPDDYFHVDEKKEAEWRRRKRYENPIYERPTAIF
jgi:hypothetical protein